MPLPLNPLLGGAVFLLVVSSLFSPSFFRRLVFSSGIGCALGYALTSLNNMRGHSFKALTEPIHLGRQYTDFSTMYKHVYGHISIPYDERGQLDVGEEKLTVMQNVFAQIGVIDIEGIRKMWTSVIIPQLRLCDTDGASVNYMQSSPMKIEEDTVFCDIGSGVGNVCLQILAETRSKKVVGIEVIPSRHRNAIMALANAKSFYPEVFADKSAIFLNDDFVNCTSRLIEEKVNVIFTHSWMFDDDLMVKLTELVAAVPTVRCVVTSRKLADSVLLNGPLKLVSQVHLTADWNDQAPFYVYRKSQG